MIFIIICFTLFPGCNKASNEDDKFRDKAPEDLVPWDVISVTGPLTALVNQTVIFEVTYPASSGCDYVSKFVTIESGNDILVKAYGNTLKNTFCTMAAVPKKINYEFTPVVKGQFVFKFINRDNSVKTHIITFI